MTTPKAPGEDELIDFVEELLAQPPALITTIELYNYQERAKALLASRIEAVCNEVIGENHQDLSYADKWQNKLREQQRAKLSAVMEGMK